MLQSALHIALALVVSSVQAGFAAPGLSPQASPQALTPNPAISLPAGSKLELVLTRALWSKTAKPGDPVYLQASFPLAIGKAIAIPAGTYVQAEIVSVKRPGWLSARAELHLRFTTMVFANGYTVSLDNAAPQPSATPESATVQNTSNPSAAAPPTTLKSGPRALVTVQVAHNSDVLLDNGASIELTLTSPLWLNAEQVATAIPLSRAPSPGQLRATSLCRPTPATPGTPGTPDTVIPGSPGTPSISIPGGPGMPDTTIPGTPPTPPTVIPGAPGTLGTPEIPCPAPPLVLSSTPENPPPGPPPPHS